MNRKTFINSAARAVLVALCVMLAVFFLVRIIPGDPAVMILGEHADPGALEEVRRTMGLDLPFGAQFVRFLTNVFTRGDTGDSIKYGISCRTLIFRKAPVTLLLILLSMAVTSVLSVLLAFAAAIRRDSIFDRVIRVVPAVTQGMPEFWTGLLFILVFAVHLRIFPVGGTGTGAAGLLTSLILPALTVLFGQIPPLVRSLRQEILEVLDSDFVTALKAAGLPFSGICLRHVLRNALVPALMLFGVNVSYLIGGTLVIEQVFDIDGVGGLLFEAISNRDYPLIQAVALYCAVLVVLVSLLTDLLVRRIDPATGE